MYWLDVFVVDFSNSEQHAHTLQRAGVFTHGGKALKACGTRTKGIECFNSCVFKIKYLCCLTAVAALKMNYLFYLL